MNSKIKGNNNNNKRLNNNKNNNETLNLNGLKITGKMLV